MWTGGPLPWVDKPESHFHRVRLSEPGVADVGARVTSARSVPTVAAGDNVFVFDVVCKTVGETDVTLEVMIIIW